jgi:hypothetical protein
LHPSRLDNCRQTDVWRSRNSRANSRTSRDRARVKAATGANRRCVRRRIQKVEGEHIIVRSIQGGRGNATIVVGMGADNVYAKREGSI